MWSSKLPLYCVQRAGHSEIDAFFDSPLLLFKTNQDSKQKFKLPAKTPSEEVILPSYKNKQTPKVKTWKHK